MSGREPAIGASDEIDFGTDRANPSQFEAQAIPESHPVLTRLNELFGDHTFFVDSDGLSIVEETNPVAMVRRLASIAQGLKHPAPIFDDIALIKNRFRAPAPQTRAPAGGNYWFGTVR
jgi:hypothetical protein